MSGGGASPAALYGATSSMVLQDFNGPVVPRNGDGDTDPSQYGGAGAANVSLDSRDAVTGNSLRMDVPSGGFYAQFNPYNYTGTAGSPGGRSFARDYSSNPAGWQFNTYNRLSFWVQRPTSAAPLDTSGNFYDFQVGTYVKQITNAPPTSDETGGGHYYHLVGVPNLGPGTWTQVILNPHPDHERSVNADPGVVNYPTATDGPNGGGDPPGTYNYFDAMTRLYLDDSNAPTTGTYRLDDFTFYKEPYAENDQQVFSITSTYVPAANRVLVTWKRDWASDTISDEVRYAFSDIHQTGWAAAAPAPNGLVAPPSSGAYNGMVYDTTGLPLAGHSVVYIAVKPQNSDLFTEIAVPLTGFPANGGTPAVTPAVTGESPAPGATGVPTGAAATATFNESVTVSAANFTLSSPSGAVAAAVSYNDATHTATLTPSAPLAAGTTYTGTVSGVKDAAGNTMAAPFNWSFTTASPVPRPVPRPPVVRPVPRPPVARPVPRPSVHRSVPRPSTAFHRGAHPVFRLHHTDHAPPLDVRHGGAGLAGSRPGPGGPHAHVLVGRSQRRQHG
jgi:hypothetical protein